MAQRIERPLAAGDGVRVTVSQRHSIDEYIAVQSYERYHAQQIAHGAGARLRRHGRCAAA